MTGPVVMVSGANGGIGRVIVRKLLEEQFRVSVGVRNPAGASELFSGYSRDLLAIGRYEATEEQSCGDWADATVRAFGRIDGLVNNAGVFLDYDIEAGDERNLDAMLSINFKAVLRIVRSVVPLMKKGGGGKIISIASLAGIRPSVVNVGYAASKAALIAASHYMRVKYWDDGIRCTTIAPGGVGSEMTADLSAKNNARRTDPSDVANAVVFLLRLHQDASVSLLTLNGRPESLW